MSLKSRLIIGRQPILEAIESGKVIDKILVQSNLQGDFSQTIQHLSKANNIPLQYVPQVKLNALTKSNHQGVVAFSSLVVYQSLDSVIQTIFNEGKSPLLLMLDGVTDVRNIGAIARSAVCFGVHAIIIPDKGVGALNEEAVKSSAGALEKINICRVNSLMKTVDELHALGIKVFAADVKATQTIHQLNSKEPCCFIMGSEDRGIYAPLQKLCDEAFTILMSNSFESLNVSVATGIILAETFRQRQVN